MTVCDTNTNMCTGCVVDANCGLGTVCDAGTCVPGCTDMQPCQVGTRVLRRPVLRPADRPRPLRRLLRLPGARQRLVGVHRRRVCVRRVRRQLQQLRRRREQRLRDRRHLRVHAQLADRLLLRPGRDRGQGHLHDRQADLQRPGHRLRRVHRRGPARSPRTSAPTPSTTTATASSTTTRTPTATATPSAAATAATRSARSASARSSSTPARSRSPATWSTTTATGPRTTRCRPATPAWPATRPSATTTPGRSTCASSRPRTRWGSTRSGASSPRRLTRANGVGAIERQVEVDPQRLRHRRHRAAGQQHGHPLDRQRRRSERREPGLRDFQGGVDNGADAPAPADWLAANGNTFPNAPGLPRARASDRRTTASC
jgi:hypothetical protein